MSSPSSLHISIPRAGYAGLWSDFVADNTLFFPYDELDRIERALRGPLSRATHVASSAGEFEIVASFEPSQKQRDDFDRDRGSTY